MRSWSTSSSAVCGQGVMAGSVPLLFVAPFVPCPVCAISHCMGLITLPYTGLPIPLVTNLWHATCSSLCAILVVYKCLMCLICMCCCRTRVWCVCVCVYTLTSAHETPGRILFYFGRVVSYQWLLDTRSPSEGLVEAAISTQHSPQTTWEAFYPALCSLFFNQHFSFTCLSSQIASFVFFFHNEPVSPTTWLCILFLFHFQKCIFRWRLSFCSEKCHRSKCRQAKTPQRLHGAFS